MNPKIKISKDKLLTIMNYNIFAQISNLVNSGIIVFYPCPTYSLAITIIKKERILLLLIL